MKLDLLAFAAHPDDVELSCSGTMIRHMQLGYKTGIVDLTRGELGTRGNAALRKKEAEEATKILGLSARENLGLPDGFFTINEASLLAVVRMIRKYRPSIVLANSVADRHPDHGRASQLVREACFLSGLVKVETELDGKRQEAWRPEAVYFYIQDRMPRPDLIVDISGVMEQRVKAIMAFSSQFYNPESTEPETMISSKQFLEILKSRASDLGRTIGVEYGEGFTVERPPGVGDLMGLR
jgi:bacillithiol biosynthesis deacetylase BshB1